MTDPIDRERALYRYHLALQRGDFAAVAAILREAESDPELARMVLALNAALEAEEAAGLPSPALSPLRSTNGQRPPGAPIQEDYPMTFTTLASPAQSTRPVRAARFAPSLTLIAALVAVALFGALLLLNQSGGLFATGGGNLPPNGGGDPLSAGAPRATATPTVTPSATPIPANVSPAMPIVVTATPMLIPDGFGPTMIPPTALPWGPSLIGQLPVLPVGETMTGYLVGDGNVGIYWFDSPEDGTYSLSVTALDFEPRLLVYTLDDPDLGIQRTAEDGPLPSVTLDLGRGDRMLVFVYSADRAASGQYLISVRAG
jgi:hypothetical protein